MKAQCINLTLSKVEPMKRKKKTNQKYLINTGLGLWPVLLSA